MRNNAIEEIWEKIKSVDKIAMTLHYAPDGDSLGSCTAMKYFLEKHLNKKVTLVSFDKLSENLMTFPFAKEVQFDKDISELNSDDFDLYLFLDSDIKNQSGKMTTKYVPPKDKLVINIDHHATNSFFGSLNYVDSSKPSACSVLIDMLTNLKIVIDKELATRLLLGVCTDSGFFTFSNGKDALKDANFLIEKNADYDLILREIQYNTPLKLKKFFAIQFTKLKINKEKKFAYVIIPWHDIKDLKLNKAEVRLGINDMQMISGFDFVFNLIELEDEIKGSFRSSKGVDISKFAEELGGGGHKAAAGFILKKMPLEEAEKKVLETIERVGIHK